MKARIPTISPQALFATSAGDRIRKSPRIHSPTTIALKRAKRTRLSLPTSMRRSMSLLPKDTPSARSSFHATRSALRRWRYAGRPELRFTGERDAQLAAEVSLAKEKAFFGGPFGLPTAILKWGPDENLGSRGMMG